MILIFIGCMSVIIIFLFYMALEGIRIQLKRVADSLEDKEKGQPRD